MLLASLLACAPTDDSTPSDGGSTPSTETGTPTGTDVGTPTDTGRTPTDTGPLPPSCDPVSSFLAGPGDQFLEERFTVDVPSPQDVWVACTSPEDPLERHLLESAGPATHHELRLRGLLPGTTYTCQARSECGGDRLSTSFGTDRPEGVPQLTATHTPGQTSEGAYTLFDEQGGCGDDSHVYVAIVDPDAKLRWLYDLGTDLIVDVDAQIAGPDRIHLGGGWGLFDENQPNRGVFRDVDLSGHTLLDRAQPDFGLGFNHHSEALRDGTYLSLTGHTDTNGSRDWNGVGVELWSPTGGVVWTWDTQALATAGLVQPPTPLEQLLLPSPYLVNSASFVTDALGDALWLSDLGYQEIWRVDRATGERTHVFGVDGDFTLVDPQGHPLPDSEYCYVQHGPDYEPDGHLLAYDNGTGRPGGSYSRVVEYQLDLQTRVATRLWDWTEPGWSDQVTGDADYLPGGHVLVTQGFSRCLEILARDVSEIVELAPPSTVVERITWPNSNWAVYRSERYDGCAVFSNARYCQALADRWDQLGI